VIAPLSDVAPACGISTVTFNNDISYSVSIARELQPMLLVWLCIVSLGYSYRSWLSAPLACHLIFKVIHIQQQVKSAFKVILRLTVSQPASQPVLVPMTNFFPLLSIIIFRQLQVCWCGAPSLWWEVGSVVLSFWHSRSQIWVPRESWAYFIVSIFKTPQTWSARFLFNCPRNRVAQLYPRALGIQQHITSTVFIVPLSNQLVTVGLLYI
jgi:hypothetical protein